MCFALSTLDTAMMPVSNSFTLSCTLVQSKKKKKYLPQWLTHISVIAFAFCLLKVKYCISAWILSWCDYKVWVKCGVSFPQCSSRGLEGGTVLTVFSVVPLVQAVTINYHHTTGSRAPSLDDDEEEEDRLHAMISMICSRNLTDPNVMKGFYHLNTPTQPYCPPHSWDLTRLQTSLSPPNPTSPQLHLPVCVLPEAEPNRLE